MDYTSKCYKKTALAQVIVRLDFRDYIESDKLFCEAIENTVLPNFPKKGIPQIIRFQMMNVKVDTKETKTEQTTRDGVQQDFVDSDGNKLALSNKYIILEINKYTSYKKMLDVFEPVIERIFEVEKLSTVRTGIRYVNLYNDQTIKPQKKYFILPISSLLRQKKLEGLDFIRTINLTEYEYEDMHLHFRYGQYSNNYPRPANTVLFALDYDCFCDLPLYGFDENMKHIDKGHNVIQQLFEDSITEQLREVMGNGHLS